MHCACCSSTGPTTATQRLTTFMAELKSNKRKSVRNERKSMAAQGLRIERLRGKAITKDVWEAFYRFYMDTSGAHLPGVHPRAESQVHAL